MFRQAFFCEEMNGLWWSSEYDVWRWCEAEIYVSILREDNAVFCHFSAIPDAIRGLKLAINEFVATVFRLYSWCAAVMACIKLPSVERLVKKCGFEHVLNHDYVKVYARYR